MPVQDTAGTYVEKFPLAYAGMVADTIPHIIVSKTVEDSTIAFGLAVGAGSADQSVKLGGTGFQGVTVADKAQTQDYYLEDGQAGVMRKGRVWVTVGAAVTPTSTVYFTPSTGVITSTSTDNTAIDGAKFETSADADGLALLYLG